MPNTTPTTSRPRTSESSARASLLLSLFLLVPCLAIADMGPPVHMQISETEEGLYTVRWRVPKALPPRAVPTPMLPESCRPTTEATVVQQPAAWLVEAEWRCETSIAGQMVGMDYPYPDLSLTTVVRVDLLSGDRFAHVLNQGEESWQLPEGTAAPDILKNTKRAVLAGAFHAAFSWLHLLFLVVLGLLGGSRRTITLVTVFAAGQVAGVFGASLFAGIGAVAAQIAFAVGIIVMARQVLEPDEGRTRLWAPLAAAGFAHGLGLAAMLGNTLGDGETGTLTLLFAVLGMDAVHLVVGIALTALLAAIATSGEPARPRRLMAYGIGATGVALALGLAMQGGVARTDASTSSIQMPTDSPTGSSSATPGSRRVAPSMPNAPIQSYLSVEPFEVRHEVMLRLAGLVDELDLDPDETLEIDAQGALAERLAQMVFDNTSISIDGEQTDGLLRRADFMTVDLTGALPRPNPVPETVADAVMGVIIAYPTSGIPRLVSLEWLSFPSVMEAIPATVIDPEVVTSSVLSPDENDVEWRYALSEDPIPTVEAVPVEPVELPIPWLALPFLVLAAALVVAGLRGDRTSSFVAAARVVLAVALVIGPLVETSIALPGSSGRTPSERQARRILAGLLPNIYRALEFRSEELIYDRLAISVTGETLSDVYLEQRRALEMEERGGAQARVEAVEVLKAAEISKRDHGFGVRAEWTVGGMVTHFGHRHFRQNRYNALIDVVPIDGTWKIRSIEILETERVK